MCRDYGLCGNGLGTFFHRNHYANLIHVYRITRVYILHTPSDRLLKEEKKNLTRLELDILTLSRKPNRFVFVRNKVSENDGATMDGVAFSSSLLKSHSPRRNIRWKEHFRCLA